MHAGLVLGEFFGGFAVLDDFIFGFAVSNTPQCPPLLFVDPRELNPLTEETCD